ncbi:MFS general substrate transporter [Gautieria morchelliformis]|nr:MFS general substrate transporter [Gautieria morchelliformis]
MSLNEDHRMEQHRGSPHKRRVTPLPKLQLSVLLYLLLAEPITSTVILPFIVQLVEETGITGGDVSKVGYYAGLVESIFFFIEALMILQWGRLSDRIGRRPILLTGLFGLGISMLCFGLSRTFWSVVASRALAGALNGNAGVIKCMLSEITDDTNLDRGLSFIPIVWSVGNTLGPLIGGSLQHPYERFGAIFRSSTFWQTYPYFLPCVTAAVYSTSAFFLAFILLKETCPALIIRQSQIPGRTSQLSGVDDITPMAVTECSPLIPPPKIKPKHVSLRDLLTSRVLVVILNYALLALADMAFTVLLPVYLSTPISNGGLGMSPSLTGVCLAGFGIVNGVVSILLFVPIHRRIGTRAILWSCEAAFIACFALFPVMNKLARDHDGLCLSVWIVFLVQLALGTLPSMAFSATFIFLTSAVPSRSALGATTGLAQTVASTMRAIGPAGATSLFALSVEHNLLGGTLVYWVLCLVSAGGTLAATRLPAMPWRRPGE